MPEEGREVSIIVPCLNEERRIGGLLEALRRQTFPSGSMEVVIADGMSTDRTRAVVDAFRAADRGLAVSVVDNPRRTIPAALNRAIAASSGRIVIRLDAHSAPEPDYVERCVAALDEGRGDNVGGVILVRPGDVGVMAEGIAIAASHPVGVGDAHYRHANEAQSVDTVPFGAFRRELIDRVGPFDEDLLVNEDYELNVRVRRSGGTIWLDPAIRCEYYARPDLRRLAVQYWRYGAWKQRMLRKNPTTIRARQAAPALFVLSLGVLPLFAGRSRAARSLLSAEVGAYSLVLAAVGIVVGRRERRAALAGTVPVAIATMHLSWGAGFVSGVLGDSIRRDA